MIELLTKTFPEFLKHLWRGDFARREAWAIADYVAVLIVISPYVAILAALAVVIFFWN